MLAGDAAAGPGDPPGGEGPRAGAARRVGDQRRRRCWRTWTSTSRPTSPACCRWWPRWCRGHSDVAIGTPARPRRARRARARSASCISRGYNALLRATLRTRFSDAQCGFKAIRADAARELLPRGRRTRRGSSTPSCCVLAERAGMRIHEVPVDWVDDPDSRVDIVRPLDDLRGIGTAGPPAAAGATPAAGSARSSWRQHRAGFALIGVASTLAYSCSTCCCAARCGAQAANAAGAACHRRRQHRGEPALHVRRARPRGGGAPPAGGARRVRARASP